MSVIDWASVTQKVGSTGAASCIQSVNSGIASGRRIVKGYRFAHRTSPLPAGALGLGSAGRLNPSPEGEGLSSIPGASDHRSEHRARVDPGLAEPGYKALISVVVGFKRSCRFHADIFRLVR